MWSALKHLKHSLPLITVSNLSSLVMSMKLGHFIEIWLMEQNAHTGLCGRGGCNFAGDFSTTLFMGIFSSWACIIATLAFGFSNEIGAFLPRAFSISALSLRFIMISLKDIEKPGIFLLFF